MGDEVAFGSGQIAAIVGAETLTIEQSDGLARLDAGLLGLVSKLEQQDVSSVQPAAVAVATSITTVLEPLETAEADDSVSEPEPELTGVPFPQKNEVPEDASGEAGELVADLPAGRSARRRA